MPITSLQASSTRVQTARTEIACEHPAAAQFPKEITAELEVRVLGTPSR